MFVQFRMTPSGTIELIKHEAEVQVWEEVKKEVEKGLLDTVKSFLSSSSGDENATEETESTDDSDSESPEADADSTESASDAPTENGASAEEKAEEEE